MAQNARSHRKLKIAGIVALVAVVALLGFAGNFLFDFALNPQAPYTMKMMQDSKNDKEGEQPDAEDTEARAWFKENRESSNLTADDGTAACRLVFCCVGEHARLRRLPAWIYQRAHRHGPIRQALP